MLRVTRRGSGAYVADPTAGPFRIAAPKAARLADILEVMELRLAVEVEAAALAAERGSRRQIGVIRSAWRAIDEALHRGEGAVAEDFAFHRAIAEATGNRQFPRFIVTNQGVLGAATPGTGGMNSLGPFTQGPSKERRPSGTPAYPRSRGSPTGRRPAS